MNTINRVAVVLVLLLLLIGVSLALIVPQLVLPGFIRTLDNIINMSDGFGRILLVIGALLFDALMLFLIVLELWPRRTHMVRVAQASGGTVRLDLNSISDRIAYQIDQMPDVISVKPIVHPHRKGVEILMEVTTAPDVDVPAKAEEIIERTQTVVTEKMGLKLAGTPKVHVRIAPLPKGKAAPAADRRL